MWCDTRTVGNIWKVRLFVYDVSADIACTKDISIVHCIYMLCLHSVTFAIDGVMADMKILHRFCTNINISQNFYRKNIFIEHLKPACPLLIYPKASYQNTKQLTDQIKTDTR